MKTILFLSVLISLPSFAGIYYNNQWSHYAVTTCFADAENETRDTGETYVLKVRKWKESNKAKVKEWVEQEFSAERTGIHFTGFLDCAESPNAEVVIFHNKNSKLGTYFFGGLHGLANLGPSYGSVKGYPAASAFVSISSSGMNIGTVIHEFGHSAGLHHEHIHPDAFKSERGCASVKPNQIKDPEFVYEDFDRDSVMSYCRLERHGGNKIGLSKKDVDLLKRLYP
jgi:hypothetical protein